MDDPHYRPPFSLTETRRLLQDARSNLTFPRFVDRDDYVREHGFEAWDKVNSREYAVYHETRQILEDALKAVNEEAKVAAMAERDGSKVVLSGE